MFKFKITKVPLYSYKLVTVITDSAKKLQDKFELDFEDDYPIYAHCISHYLNVDKDRQVKAVFIILNPNSDDEVTHGVIAHEALHAMHMIMNDVDIYPTYEDDEPHAYLIEWIVNEVTKNYNESFNRRN